MRDEQKGLLITIYNPRYQTTVVYRMEVREGEAGQPFFEAPRSGRKPTPS
jgi:hypothetical protein